MYGSILKFCRESKGYTQKKVAKNIIDRSTLSKFENQEIDISVTTFFKLLSNIGISITEFLFIANNRQLNEKDDILNSFYSITNNADVLIYENIKNRCELFLDKKDDIQINDIQVLSKWMIYLNRTKELEYCPKIEKEANKILERLNTQSFWFIDDLQILNHLFPLIEYEEVHILAKEILIKSISYDKLRESDLLIATIYINISYLHLSHKKNENAKILLTHALELSKKLNRVDLISICYVRLGIIDNDEVMTNNGFEILELVGDTKLLSSLRDEYNLLY